MIYIIYIQRFTSVQLKTKIGLIYINLYNLHLLIYVLYVLYSASIRHAGISAIEKQFYYHYINRNYRKQQTHTHTFMGNFFRLASYFHA